MNNLEFMREFTTNDIKEEFIRLYNKNEFRIIGNDTQQSKTLEIQNVHFEVDKPYILREPNYEYFLREKKWYLSESLNVSDIEGEVPTMWKKCATPLGYINSNYGWCIFSKDNFEQYKSCIEKLISDQHTREACMIYTRPSIQQEYNKNGMHDFICTYSTQYFINERDNQKYVDCIVYMRSNDAVYGFCNDALWQMYVLEKLAYDLSEKLGENINKGKLYWNAGSLHVYARHFKYLVP